MSKQNPLRRKIDEELRKFRVDVSLVVVGLFLALGVQNMIQYIEAVFPHINAYFYLTIGIVSLLMVLVFLNLAAKDAGIDQRVRGNVPAGP